MAELTIEGLSKSFGVHQVLPPLDLTVEDGSFTVLVGPSGCGKSTLLRIVAGLEDPTTGLIHLDGEEITLSEPADRGIAMVFQSYALYPHMTVEGNIEFGLRLSGVPASERRQRIRDAAETLQLQDLLDRKPAHLSGGQRQRVAIGRAIVRDPKLFLFDEPLSNLDAALRGQMRVELGELHKRLDATMIYVTHDQVEAMTLADRIVVMNEGRIEQVGSPMELYTRPANRFVAEFIGAPKMNIVGGALAGAFGASLMGVRPEHLRIVAPAKADAWPAKIRLVERLGAETIVYLSVETHGDMIARFEGPLSNLDGDMVHVAPMPEHLHYFDAEGRSMEPTVPASSLAAEPA